MAKAESSALHDKLKEKKKEVVVFEQEAKSAKAEVGFLRKQLDTMISKLFANRLRLAGFANSVWVHAQIVFSDFSPVYEELGASIHPLDLEGKGLFNR